MLTNTERVRMIMGKKRKKKKPAEIRFPSPRFIFLSLNPPRFPFKVAIGGTSISGTLCDQHATVPPSCVMHNLPPEMPM